MLINLSNHPSDKWDEKQCNAAKKEFVTVIDVQFPDISPFADLEEIKKMANEYVSRSNAILSQSTEDKNAVHITGELTFVFQFVTIAKNLGIKCLCSTTQRNVSSEGNIKTSVFNFIQFREY